MAVLRAMLVLSVVFILAITSSSGLQCFTCVNFNSQGSEILKFFSGKTNPDCDDSPQDVATVDCGSGEVCAYQSGDISIFGQLSVGVHIRSCSPQVFSTGCHESNAINSLVSGFLEGADFKGQICYCNTPLCDARCDGYSIGNFCMTKVVMGCVIGGAILLIVLLCTCCCCCCCSCCRRKNPTPVVISQGPQLTMIHSYPAQAHQPMAAIRDPGFGYRPLQEFANDDAVAPPKYSYDQPAV